MSNDNFNNDDLSSTLARFAGKHRRGIVFDESKLKRKAPEPVELSSATHNCGLAVLKNAVSIVDNSDKAQDIYKSPLKYSWEKEGFFRHKDGFN